MKGGLPGRSASGKNTRTRAVTGIDGDIRLNKALWMIAEKFREYSIARSSVMPQFHQPALSFSVTGVPAMKKRSGRAGGGTS